METNDLLKTWSMPEDVIKKFEEENIDCEALQNLLLEDLKILIPSIGLRTKFRVQWTEWRNREIEKTFPEETAASHHHQSTSSSIKSSDKTDESDSHQKDKQSSVSAEIKDTSCSYRNPLRELLLKHVQYKTLLPNNHLTKSQRCSVAKLVVQHLIESTPGYILKPAQLDQWANYLKELFPEEDKKFYFFSVGAEVSTSSSSRQSFGSRQLPSKGRRYYGCFWDNWNNERKKLREKLIIPFVKKNSQKNITAGTSSDSTKQETDSQGNPLDLESNQEAIIDVIKGFQGKEITEYLKDAWKKTRKERLAILSNQTTTDDYLKLFKVLIIQDIAYELIHEDFAACSELIDPAIILVEELKKYSQVIIATAREKCAKFRDKTQKLVVGQIFNLTDYGNQEENVLIESLLLLPFLFSTGGKVNQKGKKASRAEAAEAFIVLHGSLAEGENALEDRREKLKSNKINLQPFVLAVGKSWSDVTSAYVVVDKPLYRFNNILDAVQMCFKVFFAFDLNYPLECEHVWQLIQRGFFKICLPTDKIILGVNQVMDELQIM